MSSAEEYRHYDESLFLWQCQRNFSYGQFYY